MIKLLITFHCAKLLDHNNLESVVYTYSFRVILYESPLHQTYQLTSIDYVLNHFYK